MNKKTRDEILEFFSSNKITYPLGIKNQTDMIWGATDNLQGADPHYLVFYKLGLEQKEMALFEERLTKSEAPIVVTTQDLPELFNRFKKHFIVLSGSDFLLYQKKICDFFYPINKEKKIKMVGITGTNGKTTTTHLCLEISEKLQHKALGIGTLGLTTVQGVKDSEFSTTTPSYLQLRKIIFLYQNEFDVIFMEVSSHALKQQRVFDIKFDVLAWSNFTQDHLDYHQTMDDYFESKKLLFMKHRKDSAILFLPSSQNLLKKKLEDKDFIRLCDPLPSFWMNNLPVFFQNKFNQDNLELASSLNMFLWEKDQSSLARIQLSELGTPSGRFSTFIHGNKMVVVDYAHTPDAILNVVKGVSDNFKGRSISVLFGCGGNRDKSKRPLMLEAAKKYSQSIYITSDNPRFENPEDIINDILTNYKDHRFQVEIDRKVAILKALNALGENDVLLILGKGHETYQEIKGKKEYFSDQEIVKEYFKGL